MRYTIGGKIFSIAFGLVAMMAVTAFASSYYVRQVNLELARVSGIYIPLTAVVEGVRHHALQQKLDLERAIRDMDRGETDAIESADSAALRAGDAAIAALIDRGRVLLQAVSESGLISASGVELGRLHGQLEVIGREQEALRAARDRVLDRSAAGDGAERTEARATVDARDTVFIAATGALSRDIESFTETAARVAVRHERRVYQLNVVATALAAVLAVLVAGMVVRNLVRPIRGLVDATREVEQGNLSPQLETRSSDEIGDLTRSFQRMTGELRAKERIKETFGRYVDPRIVEALIGAEGDAFGSGVRREYTVFFSDIAGFTGLSERLTPSALVELVNAYLTAMSGAIRESNGVIDKYIGDAIMAYWGPPFVDEGEHARLACDTALRQHVALEEFRGHVPELTGLRRDYPDVDMRIGIATGEVVVGNVGSATARNYTVIGDTVNLASRLESLNKHYGTRILIAHATAAECTGQFELREVDAVAVAGKTEIVRVFELLAVRGELDGPRAELRDRYEEALHAYRKGQWDDARAGFAACQALSPGDGPSRVLLDRIASFGSEPPGEDWDGSWRIGAK